MALVPFAKPAALQTLTGIDEAQAELVLDLVSATIRASVGWDIDKVTNATYTQTIRRGSWLDAIVLPAMNLTAVSTIVVDGVTLASSQWDATPAGVIYLKSVRATESVVVTYTAGWVREPQDQAPPILRAVALDYAQRMLNTTPGVKSYALGGTSETFGDELQTVADADNRLDPYRVNQ